MTVPLRPTQSDFDGLDAIQAEIVLKWVKEINDTWELDQITVPKAETVLHRVLAIVVRAPKRNRGDYDAV